MNWEQKTEMCQLLNSGKYEEAVDLVVQNLETMDEQAWDMYTVGMLLTEENINKNREKHLKIIEYSKEVKFDSFRSAIRMAYYEELVSPTIK